MLLPLKFSELFQVLSILGSLSALMRFMNVNMDKVLYSIMIMIMINIHLSQAFSI